MPRSPNQVLRSSSWTKGTFWSNLYVVSAPPQKAISTRLTASATSPAASRGSGESAMKIAPPSGSRIKVSVSQPFATSAHRDEDDGEDGEAGGHCQGIGADEAGLETPRAR